jgi:putative phosphoribosyl transferase
MRTDLSLPGPALGLHAPSEVRIDVGTALLSGELELPPDCDGLVVFAHGSGSSRHSPRERALAAALREHAIGTLRFDLRSPEEESLDRIIGWMRFEPEAMAARVRAAVDWLRQQPLARGRRVGLLGSGTGAAAALIAASRQDSAISAVVCRAGRPDLARRSLSRVVAPTLLVVGDQDRALLDCNRGALPLLGGHAELAVVAGAGPLFREPDALPQAADRAADWFRQFLGAHGATH